MRKVLSGKHKNTHEVVIRPLYQTGYKMKECHELDCTIDGSDMQIINIELDKGETVIAEAGTMIYMEDGIEMEAKMGDGSEASSGFFGKIFSAGKRALTGESIFLTHFTNEHDQKRSVSFSSANPGKAILLDMKSLGGKVICQKDAFLCASKGTSIGMHLNTKLGSGFFGGEGFIMQSIEGDDIAVLQAGGYIVEKKLTKGNKLRVDTGCVVAFTSDIEMDIEKAGSGIKSMLFSGEGIFLSTLEGEGTVWIQSLPFSRMADKIISRVPSSGGSSFDLESDD